MLDQAQKVIKVKFSNGLNLENFSKEVFEVYGLEKYYHFEEDSNNPDFIIFGPYGHNLPAKGDYIRIGYFCENITPALESCEWAFGIPFEEEVRSPRYQRIQWHGLKPEKLIKPRISEPEALNLLKGKKKFCNFIYSHKVPYREQFFRRLSKYKKVDAPGKSMNNMPSFDAFYQGSMWERKRAFMAEYKFTIAFENYSYPGYQTEKLYDAMQANSLPIYCGDPLIGDIFNLDSFLSAFSFTNNKGAEAIDLLAKKTQIDFEDMQPQHFTSPYYRIKRKVKSIGRHIKMDLQYNSSTLDRLIEKVIELDNNDELYLSYLKEPWFPSNRVPDTSHIVNRWREIFG